MKEDMHGRVPALADMRAQIRERNYIEIPFLLDRAYFETAAKQFMNFLSYPDTFKSQFHFKLYPDDDGSDVGYVRTISATGKDDKEYFHYHPLIEERYAELIHEDDVITREFFDAAAVIYHNAEESLDAILTEFTAEFPGLREQFFVHNTPRRFYLRFLKYETRGLGKFLARAHYDRGGCTLALSESAPGLRIGVDDAHLQEVTHKEHMAVFMPALRFPELTSFDFPSAWHDVVQSSREQYTENVARWAIVFFADTHDMRAPSTEETHTPRKSKH